MTQTQNDDHARRLAMRELNAEIPPPYLPWPTPTPPKPPRLPPRWLRKRWQRRTAIGVAIWLGASIVAAPFRSHWDPDYRLTNPLEKTATCDVVGP